ncbi:MAG: hypothetical protein ABL956_05835 [Hyphomonadaceae bacterium]
MMLVMDDARTALGSLGGERSHPRYVPGASETMMASLRLHHAQSEQDFADVHALAVAEMGTKIASLEEIKRVDAMTDATIWMVRRNDAVTGFLATLALTTKGVAALADGSFDAADIDEKWVVPLGQPLAGFYCWCYAGRDQVSRGALVVALRTLIDRHFPDLPFFGRDSTEAGAKIMRHLGFFPFDGVQHLFWRCRMVMDAAA